MKITILLKGIVIFTSVRRSYHSHSKTWNIQREIPMQVACPFDCAYTCPVLHLCIYHRKGRHRYGKGKIIRFFSHTKIYYKLSPSRPQDISPNIINSFANLVAGYPRPGRRNLTATQARSWDCITSTGQSTSQEEWIQKGTDPSNPEQHFKLTCASHGKRALRTNGWWAIQ